MKLSPITAAVSFLVLWIVVYAFLDPITSAFVGLLPLPPAGHLTDAVRFFVFEVPKVLLLLVIVVFGVGIIRSYFSPERTRRMLANKPLFAGNVLAASLGVVTPFCSCSAVPLFIGFVETGIPLGVTFSFLVAAPMINEVALVLLWGLFGWQTALLYASTGLVIAIASGYVIGKLKVERYIEDWVLAIHAQQHPDEISLKFSDRITMGFQSVREVVGKVWPYVIAGIAVGAGVHGYVPENFLAGIMGRSAWWAVPVSVLIGIPLYSNAAGIIPIVHALLEKGASLGTTLAFMMAVIGLSLPETIILRKVIKLPLIAIFVGVVGTGILLVGYLFNAIY
ncbi:MAG: permease [Ignavibacteriae bacterium]|nr:permease [Ignavibacteriota bacterium]